MDVTEAVFFSFCLSCLLWLTPMAHRALQLRLPPIKCTTCESRYLYKDFYFRLKPLYSYMSRVVVNQSVVRSSTGSTISLSKHKEKQAKCLHVENSIISKREEGCSTTAAHSRDDDDGERRKETKKERSADRYRPGGVYHQWHRYCHVMAITLLPFYSLFALISKSNIFSIIQLEAVTVR